MSYVRIANNRVLLKAFALWLGSVTLVAGCDDDKSSSVLPIEPDLLKTPVEVHSPFGRLKLEVAAWRDFQPISPPDGKPLIITGRLINTDSVAIQDSVWISFAYVVFGKEVWKTRPTGETRQPAQPNVIEFVLRDGPKWEPGVLIDVIVRIEDKTGATYLLRVRDREIIKTE